MKPRALSLCTALAAVLFLLSTEVRGQNKVAENPETTRILFVFDASNSMNAFWGQRRKWDVARELLSASLDSLYGQEGLELGLRVYGHGTKHVPGQQDCDDTELIVPLGPGRNLIIQQELKKLRAQGTTPIARSLLRAADDFAMREGPGRNVILLITDGIEACDEDPCSVSRALQAQGVTIKPFIIGIGLDEKYRDTFQCVGRYFDASRPEVFEEVLEIVIDQAIHSTTAQIDLLNGKGEPVVTNFAIDLLERPSGHPVLEAVHTLNTAGKPDTLALNPVPTYDLTVHTLPPVTLKGIQLKAKTHNHIAVSAPTGFIDLTETRPHSALLDVPVRVTPKDSCQHIHTQRVGTRERYLAGTYDLEFATTPVVRVEDVTIGDGRIVPVSIPEPGLLTLNTGTAGYGSILYVGEGTRKMVVPFSGQDPSGRYTLQPGKYVVMFRAKHASKTDLSVTRALDIRAAGTHHIDF